jgi:hypothetical protein
MDHIYGDNPINGAQKFLLPSLWNSYHS